MPRVTVEGAGLVVTIGGGEVERAQHFIGDDESPSVTLERANTGNPIASAALLHWLREAGAPDANWRRIATPEQTREIERAIAPHATESVWPELEHEDSARAGIDAIRAVSQGRAFALVRDEIALATVRADAVSGDESEAADRLTAALVTESRRLLERLDVDAVVAGAASGPSLDEPFAWLLGTIGDTGRKQARELRKRAKKRTDAERWNLWRCRDHALGSPWLTGLAHVLWADRVRDRLAAEQRGIAALAMPVHEDVVRLHTKARREEERNGQRSLAFADNPMVKLPVPTMESGDISNIVGLVQRGSELLGSVTAHRLLRWEILSGYSRLALEGLSSDFRSLRVAGGWRELTRERLGLTSEQRIADVRAIAHAQAHAYVRKVDGKIGNLITLSEDPARGNISGPIEIVLGTMLMPYHVHELSRRDARTLAEREARKLVPVVDIPPLVGRDNEHGAQATLSMLVVRELRAHARALADGDGVELGDEDWARLAREAGLPASVLRNVRDRWRNDGNDGPAFLSEVSPGRYRLGSTHKAAQDFLDESGRVELASQAGGVRTAAKARASRRRRG